MVRSVETRIDHTNMEQPESTVKVPIMMSNLNILLPNTKVAYLTNHAIEVNGEQWDTFNVDLNLKDAPNYNA